MTRALLLMVILSGGCLVVPAQQTTTKALPAEYGAATMGATKSVTLTAKHTERTVTVHAMRIGECTRPVFAVREITTTRHAKFRAVDPRAALFAAILAPVTIPLSAIFTGLALAGDEPVSRKDSRPAGTNQFACSVEANQLAVTMTLPSGGVVRGVTNQYGNVDLEIPSTEPYVGSVAIAADAAEPAQLAYAVRKPPYTITREAVSECATTHHVGGRVEIKLSIDSEGFATRMWLSAGDAPFNACISQRLAGVRFPENTRAHTIKMPLELAAL